MHDIAAKIIWRVAESNAETGGGYVVRLSQSHAELALPRISSQS